VFSDQTHDRSSILCRLALQRVGWIIRSCRCHRCHQGNDRNQYLGADLTPVILAQTPQDFIAAATAALKQVAANDFPRRAKGLAREVFLTRPDVIGVQKVFDFTVNGGNTGAPFVNHLQATLDALSAVGLQYVVAGTVEHIDVTLPLDINGDEVTEVVRILDRDVILVSAGVPHVALRGNFLTGGLCGVPIPNVVPPFPSSLQTTPSRDGCTYTAVAQVNTPVVLITLKRGFVGVDVTVGGKTYRVVNTHLEVKQPDPTNPNSTIFQFLQSVELAGALRATTPAGRRLIALGDYNSIASGQTGRSDCAAISGDDGLRLRGRMENEHAGVSRPRRLQVTGRLPLLPLFKPPNWASDHGGVFGALIFPR
jgi:hypothetical protein